MIVRKLSFLYPLLLVAGCAHLSGYKPEGARALTIIPSEQTSRLESEPSTITVIRSKDDGLDKIMDALVQRAASSDRRYLSDLKLAWHVVHGEQVYVCQGRIDPVQITDRRDLATRARPQASEARGSEAATRTSIYDGVDPGSFAQDIRRREHDPAPPPTTEVPPADPSVTAPSETSPRDLRYPRGRPDLDFVTNQTWALVMRVQRCAPTDEAASDRVTVTANVW